METIKNIPFGIALFIIGAVFALLGLTGGFTIGEYTLSIQESWVRIVSSVLGVALTGIAIYLEVRPKPTNGQKTNKETTHISPSQISVTAENFFYTLDDAVAEGFPNMVQGAKRIQILGRTAVNLLGQYQKVFEKLGNEGCEIELLFVDPSSDAAAFLYGSNPQIYRSNIVAAAQHLNNLKRSLGHRIKVRVTKHAPTVSVIVIEKQEVQLGFVQVQLYFLHSAIGRDRPIFRVNFEDKWYAIFRDEFSQLWSDSEEWEASHFLEAK